MNFLDTIAAQIRRGDRLPAPLAIALQACTPVVRFGMWRRARQPRHRVNAYVVSFGNITTGGTGKTPAVIERAHAELANGRRVAVLTRGYAAPSSNQAYDSPELRGMSAYEALGDEAALILHKVPGVIVLKDPDRVSAAHRAIAKYGCDVLILDDGFQYLRLERDENVVMIDATNPFGNGHVIPRGILREPSRALSRATHLILTHTDRAENVTALGDRLRELAPGVPIRFTRHAPVAVRNLITGQRLPLEWLQDREISVACAIAHPQHFMDTLVTLGARSSVIRTGRDHAPVDHALTILPPPVIITEKDAARLTDPPPPDTFTLEMELRDLTTA